MILTSIFQLLMIFLVPFIIMKYHKLPLTKLIGTIGMAYLLGIVVAGIIFILQSLSVNIFLNKDLGEVGSFLTIALAIPLLLFSANLSETKKLSKTVVKSFFSLLISAILVTSFVFYFYAKNIGYGAELSGMAVGLYTGGTPNLNAIGNIFSLPATIIATANLSDIVIGALFYIFLLIGAKPLMKLWLHDSKDVYLIEKSDMDNIDDIKLEQFKITKGILKVVFIALLMALVSAGIGVVIWTIIDNQDLKIFDILIPSLLVGVTIFGIIGSFNNSIRKTKDMNVVGQYFILVFSFALASSINFNEMKAAFSDIIVLYGIITILVFIVHNIISKLLKVDVDCTIITLTAGLYGPAFIPAITNQLKNDELTIPGLIVGAIGYAIGTFLGLGLVLIFLL